MNSKLQLILMIILSISFAVSGHAYNKEETSELNKLNEISDEALQMVQVGRTSDAAQLLEYFSKQLEKTSNEGRLLTSDELKIITLTLDDAVGSLANEQIDINEQLNKVVKFRLVVDSITASYEPLWYGMEGQLFTALHDVKEAALNGEVELFHSQLNSFLSLYDIIYPSLTMNLPHEVVFKLETKVNYIDQYRRQLLDDLTAEQQLLSLETDLKNIFKETTEDEADPSLWWVIISTGSIILITLSYVGWRKYVGQKEKNKSSSKRLNN